MKGEQASAEGTPVLDREVRRFREILLCVHKEDVARNMQGPNSVPTVSPRTAHLAQRPAGGKKRHSERACSFLPSVPALLHLCHLALALGPLLDHSDLSEILCQARYKAHCYNPSNFKSEAGGLP